MSTQPPPSSPLDSRGVQFFKIPVERAQESLGDMVQRGLSQNPRQFEPMWFYDDIGSAIFEEITNLSEYYLTRHELSILKLRSAEILNYFQEGVAITELGSGSGKKTRTLLQEVVRRDTPATYTAIDISGEFLQSSLQTLHQTFPGIPMTGIAGEYQSSLQALPASHYPRLFLLMGSNIGNMTLAHASDLLQAIRNAMRSEDRVLVGFDRVKDPEVLRAAYDDAEGVTARFNLHMLERLQSELGAEVNLKDFRHEARWNASEERMEMYLVPKQATELRIPSLGVSELLTPDDPIWTEISQKFSTERIRKLFLEVGLSIETCWHSENEWFTVALGAPAS